MVALNDRERIKRNEQPQNPTTKATTETSDDRGQHSKALKGVWPSLPLVLLPLLCTSVVSCCGTSNSDLKGPKRQTRASPKTRERPVLD